MNRQDLVLSADGRMEWVEVAAIFKADLAAAADFASDVPIAVQDRLNGCRFKLIGNITSVP